MVLNETGADRAAPSQKLQIAKLGKQALPKNATQLQGLPLFE